MELQRICQELGIDQNADLEKICQTIRVLKQQFIHQVKVATRLPLAEEIEGNGPPIQ